MSAAHSRWARLVFVSIAATACFTVGMMSPPTTPAPSSVIVGPPPYSGWPQRKPDLAIIVTGEQHGYLKFCGCSDPQLGGFERRANIIAELKEKEWPLIAVDLGDIAYRKSGALQKQTLLKYKTSMQALNGLGYSAVGIGEQEFNLPLLEGLAEYTLQPTGASPRVLAANLLRRVEDFPAGDGKGSMIGDAVVINGDKGKVKVGTVSLVGPTVQHEIKDPTLKFDDSRKVIAGALAAFAKADAKVRVLLYHGTPEQAKELANNHPEFHLVICKSPTDEPQDAVIVGNTVIGMVGQKGRYVGVAGVFIDAENPKKFQLHWEKIAVSDKYETPADKVADHPMVKLLEDYAVEVKNQNFLTQYARVPHPVKAKFPSEKVEFVGSAKCQECHKEDFATWQQTHHSHAYDSLVNKAKKPSNRQFDGECVICHTIGFAFASGYKTAELTPDLKNVGCENCHGPGSLHVAQPENKLYFPSLSPWKVNPTDRVKLADGKFDPKVLLNIDALCQKCHDIDNDRNYNFEKYWPKIEHGKKAAIANNGAGANGK